MKSRAFRCERCRRELREGERVTPIYVVVGASRIALEKHVSQQPSRWVHFSCPPTDSQNEETPS